MDYGMGLAAVPEQQEGALNPPQPDCLAVKLPQQSLEEFWGSIICKTPGKVTTILPKGLYAKSTHKSNSGSTSSTRNAAASYVTAAEECHAKVQRIVRECHRTNEKYTDPEFDLEGDFGRMDCINGLPTSEPAGASSSVTAPELRNALTTLLNSDVLGGGRPAVALDVYSLAQTLHAGATKKEEPACVRRIDFIFDDPAFTVDGYGSTDIQQGACDDCWWLAAVATLCSMPGLMERVCVARDAECGVYGFVFYRDGEWINTVVDDALYITNKDYDAEFDNYDPTGEKERKYKQHYQTGSEALYFGKCHSANEIWLPLLEKAYAKIHGDYNALEGGRPGEAVEDMTGGVTTTISTNKILSKQKLWQELLNVNKDFVFAAASPSLGSDSETRQGLALSHAYSVLKAVEEVGEDDKKVRLVLLRNPWGRRAWNGQGEWSGAWSDGSKEWTPYWMSKLDHRFGDDGEFWISFDDLLRKFSTIDRTRLFDKNWVVTQEWTAVHVSWIPSFLATKFVVEIEEEGPVVMVLRQLDDRYFKGLEGQYEFELEFVLQEVGSKPRDYLRSSGSSPGGIRSTSAEIVLQPGKYEVLPKISAKKDTSKPRVETVVKLATENNPQKMVQIGLNYDVAHAKGGFEEAEKKKKEKERVKREQERKSAEKKEEIAKSQQAAFNQALQSAYVQGQQDGFEQAQMQIQAQAQAPAPAPATTTPQTTTGAQRQEAKAKEDRKSVEEDTTTEAQLDSNAVVGENEEGKKTETSGENDESVNDDKNKDQKEALRSVVQGSDLVIVEEEEELGSSATPLPDKIKQEQKVVVTVEEVKEPTKEESKAEEVKVEATKPETSKAEEPKPEETKIDETAAGAAEELAKQEPKETPSGEEEDEKRTTGSNVELVDNSWNAVTVIGLLVYSKGAEAKVTLVKPDF